MTESPLPPAVPALVAEGLRRRRRLGVPAPWRRPLAGVGVAEDSGKSGGSGNWVMTA